VWAPALVAFVGGGGVGWFPLAPGEVFVPGYRVSRTYVNNVNVTNTSVNITKITNVYNTVAINKTTNINRIEYANQHVNGGVTVVSRETFANARPVARNAMRVDAKGLEAAPVTHVAAVEPVRSSVFGAGKPAPAKPPATVISRPVVAQRTPPPAPRSFQQQQSQAGGRLNQQPLVRPEPQVTVTQPTRAYQTSQGAKQQPTQQGFRPFTSPSAGNSQVKQSSQPPPRVMEGQGSPQPENRNTQTPGRNEQPGSQRSFQSPQREEAKPSPQETHPLVRQAPPVEDRNPQHEQQQEQKFREWQQQRPASPPPSPPAQRPQNSRPPETRQEKPPKR
jgi:hypothetical protein